MAKRSSLKKRLEALERDIARIKVQLNASKANGNWVDEIAGSMKHVPEFDELVRLGRELRESFGLQSVTKA